MLRLKTTRWRCRSNSTMRWRMSQSNVIKVQNICALIFLDNSGRRWWRKYWCHYRRWRWCRRCILLTLTTTPNWFRFFLWFLPNLLWWHNKVLKRGWKFVGQSINRRQKTNMSWIYNINCKVENMHKSLDLSVHEFTNEGRFCNGIAFLVCNTLVRYLQKLRNHI